ncbi:kinase-like domain-containing protein [Pisolithus microcarpus]|nr:kinase-like domain-containing protein [Pisolithus microcarpus]
MLKVTNFGSDRSDSSNISHHILCGSPSLQINGKYKLADKIGGGSQGDVFCAWNILLGAEVTVKLWHSELGRALKHEYHVYKSLAGSPGILHLYWFGIGLQMITCLEFMHACDFIHCDIKPSNILTGVDVNDMSISKTDPLCPDLCRFPHSTQHWYRATYLIYKDYITMLMGTASQGAHPPPSATPPLWWIIRGRDDNDNEGRWWW